MQMQNDQRMDRDVPWMWSASCCIVRCTVVSTIAIIPIHWRLKCERKAFVQASLSIFDWITIYTVIRVTATICSVLLLWMLLLLVGWCVKIHTIPKRWWTSSRYTANAKSVIIKIITISNSVQICVAFKRLWPMGNNLVQVHFKNKSSIKCWFFSLFSIWNWKRKTLWISF